MENYSTVDVWEHFPYRIEYIPSILNLKPRQESKVNIVFEINAWLKANINRDLEYKAWVPSSDSNPDDYKRHVIQNNNYVFLDTTDYSEISAGGYKNRLCFKHEEDLLLFKLQWGL